MAVALAAAEQALEHVSITGATLVAVLSGRGQGAEQAANADESGARGCADGFSGSATVPAYRPDLGEEHLPGGYRKVAAPRSSSRP